MTVGGRVLGEVISAIGACHRGNSREVPCQVRTSRSQTAGQAGREVPLPPTLNRGKEDKKRTADFGIVCPLVRNCG